MALPDEHSRFRPPDSELVDALRAGDESAFAQVVQQHTPMLLRIASLYVKDQAAAEDVVQEAWIAALRGLPRFEGRSSFKTWLCTILVNRARTHGAREGRFVPLEPAPEDDEPTVAEERFLPDGEWVVGGAPRPWESVPEHYALTGELRSRLGAAIAALPAQQQQVLRLRDVEGFSSAEVCNILDISETNQRVLLHRGRSRVRQTLEEYFESE